MVSLEKNDHLMLARQLPLKSVALILAGGRGTRLKDLTNKRAKPAVHFGGKFRIIDFALSNCINSGIRRMGVITQYQSHTLVQHIQRGWSFFNEEMNEFVDLLPAQQRMKGENWYRGTADAWPMRTRSRSLAYNPTRMPSRTGAMWVRWKLTGKRTSIWPLWCRNWICTIAIGQFAPTMNHYRQRNSCRIAPVATG